MNRLEYRRYLGLGEQDHEPRDWNHVTLADLYGQSQAQHKERRAWQEEAMRAAFLARRAAAVKELGEP